eukprot:2931197-Alexandrium_andersonii.AAC.1
MMHWGGWVHKGGKCWRFDPPIMKGGEPCRAGGSGACGNYFMGRRIGTEGLPSGRVPAASRC